MKGFFATVATHPMSSQPFFVIGLGTILLSYSYTVWQYRLKQERRAGAVSERTKWFGRLVSGGFVVVVLLILGVVWWGTQGR